MVQRSRIHSRGLLARAMDRLRGQDQLLIRAGDELPLVVPATLGAATFSRHRCSPR